MTTPTLNSGISEELHDGGPRLFQEDCWVFTASHPDCLPLSHHRESRGCNPMSSSNKWLFISKKRKRQDVYSEKYGNCSEQFWYTSFIPPGARWTHSNEWCPHGPLSMTATCQQADKNTGVNCHSLLQGIFPTQGSNPGLLNHKQILSEISHIIQFTQTVQFVFSIFTDLCNHHHRQF